MSIERAEKLKDLLTDKYVVVDGAVPELKRFQNWTGKVRTVNMNCRALVEFDGPADTAWYDIDPDYLRIVDAPIKRVIVPPAKLNSAEEKSAVKPATTVSKSPLDAIRAQQAAKKAAAASVADIANSVPSLDAPVTTSPLPVDPAKNQIAVKLSPLDMIRKQQAAKSASEAATLNATSPEAPLAKPVVEDLPSTKAAIEQKSSELPSIVPAVEVLPPPVAAPMVEESKIAEHAIPLQDKTINADVKPMSKLDQIRKQGAAKKSAE